MENNKNSGLIVHILKYGQTVCGIRSQPKDWPPNASWVSIEGAKDANCAMCLALAKEAK